MSNYITFSISDFKQIIQDLTFSNDYDDIMLCIYVNQEKIQIKLFYVENDISTYYIGDDIIIDCTDISIMFEYKNIENILDLTSEGTIKFTLDKSIVNITINSIIQINYKCMNKFDQELIGTIETNENSINIDYKLFKKSLEYFLTTKSIKNYIAESFIYILIENNYIYLEKNNLNIKFKIKENFSLKKQKIRINHLVNFLKNKNFTGDIFISNEFPTIVKYSSNFGHLELYINIHH